MNAAGSISFLILGRIASAFVLRRYGPISSLDICLPLRGNWMSL